MHWQRLSSSAIEQSSPRYLPRVGYRGPTSPFMRVRSVSIGARIHPHRDQGLPLADMLGDDEMRALAADSEGALAGFVVSSGEIVMPMDAHIVTANKD